MAGAKKPAKRPAKKKVKKPAVLDRTTLLAQADRSRAQGRRKRAILLYAKLLQQDPRDLAVHGKIAPLLAAEGLRDQAMASFRAAADGHDEVVKSLIRAGADVRAALPDSGFTALLFAARDGRTAVVRSLLKSGVDVNAVTVPRRPGGKSPAPGTSALLLAVP